MLALEELTQVPWSLALEQDPTEQILCGGILINMNLLLSGLGIL
jgi:hypothetical protein